MDKTNSCSQAILSNYGDMTSFRYGNNNIRFRSPKCLKHYLDIKEWDNGYIVVVADYEGLGPTEDYIDLAPILENLYIDSKAFLEPIKSVKIGNYEWEGEKQYGRKGAIMASMENDSDRKERKDKLVVTR